MGVSCISEKLKRFLESMVLGANPIALIWKVPDFDNCTKPLASENTVCSCSEDTNFAPGISSPFSESTLMRTVVETGLSLPVPANTV